MFEGNITTKSGFQSSVNIAFDLNNHDKIKSFIPTSHIIPFLEEVMLSTARTATSRARVLIGAYGRGKSHLILLILALLSKKEPELFSTLFQKLEKENQELGKFLMEYTESERKLLPVIVQGSSVNMTQSLLFALEQSLKVAGLQNLMPESNFQAAVETMERWKEEYPDTFSVFLDKISTDYATFVSELNEYSTKRYEEFIEIFPKLTAGSQFHPYFHTDVVQLYEEVSKAVEKHGYHGIFIVYDEFSKYLESNISQTSSDEVKMLQDLAEKCDRSGQNQLHLLLISHKSLTNYIEQNLPKNKLDGWMGVSGRFTHHYLLGNLGQMFEMTATVIEQHEPFWSKFKADNRENFNLMHVFSKSQGYYNDELEQHRVNCYPLHPATVFLLITLSEKIAQNERTLFTFLTTNQKYTLNSFLKEAKGDFPIMTPDYLYDYFEPLLKKEAYTSSMYQIYNNTKKVIRALNNDDFHKRLIKTIAIINIVELFDLLSPTKDALLQIYGQCYFGGKDSKVLLEEILVEGKTIYCKQSDGLLKIKHSNTVDMTEEILNMIQKNYGKLNPLSILNQFTKENYFYPTAYNEEMELVRYFKFEFIDMKTFESMNFNQCTEVGTVGTIYAIVPTNGDELQQLPRKLKKITAKLERVLFCYPQIHKDIREQIASYSVMENLKTKFWDDEDALDELEMRFEDLSQILQNFLELYQSPEMGISHYFYQGKTYSFKRKSQISKLLSDISFQTFPHTPVINNEAW